MDRQPFELQRVSGMPVSDDELLADIRRVAEDLGSNSVGQKEYRRLGRFDDSTATRRFGSWNSFIKLAGLEIKNEYAISDEDLFENILKLWTHFGRQPRRSELAAPPSRISQSPYLRRFDSWGKALKAFADFANSMEQDVGSMLGARASGPARRTPRDPSLRLRFRVLSRDRFSCCMCGSSPAKVPSVVLHIDHIVPWSRGGETLLQNLQTLCDRCNLGKGNLAGGTG